MSILDNLLATLRGMDEIATFKNMDEDIQVILMTTRLNIPGSGGDQKRPTIMLKPFDVDKSDL